MCQRSMAKAALKGFELMTAQDIKHDRASRAAPPTPFSHSLTARRLTSPQLGGSPTSSLRYQGRHPRKIVAFVSLASTENIGRML